MVKDRYGTLSLVLHTKHEETWDGKPKLPPFVMFLTHFINFNIPSKTAIMINGEGMGLASRGRGFESLFHAYHLGKSFLQVTHLKLANLN